MLIPMRDALLPAGPSILIGWLGGSAVGWGLSRDPRVRQSLLPLLWLLLLITLPLTPSGEWMTEAGPLWAFLTRPPLWLPMGLIVALGWPYGLSAALRTGFAFGWLLTLGRVIGGEALANAADPLRLASPVMTVLIYGVVGFTVDRLLAYGLPALLKGEEAKDDTITALDWRWIGGGLVGALFIFEIAGRISGGPTLLTALGALWQGLGAAQTLGREWMHLTRPDEWLRMLVALTAGLGVAIPASLLLKRLEHQVLRIALSSLGTFALYGGLLTVIFPASFMPEPGPGLPAQASVLLLPLLGWTLAALEMSHGITMRSIFLLTWVLALGWVPMMGGSTIGDRAYIITTFRDGAGLPIVLLGHAIIGTVLILLLTAGDRWRRQQRVTAE